MREWAVAALEGLGPPFEQDVPKLATLLAEPNSDIAYWSATLLGRLGAAASGAVDPLATAVTSHPQLSVRQRSAWALGMIGPAAGKAAAALKSAAASDDPKLVREARRALEQIGT